MSSPSSSVAGDQDNIVAKPVRSRHLTKISRPSGQSGEGYPRLAPFVKKNVLIVFTEANRRQSRGEKRRKSTMTSSTHDTIDLLVGIVRGSHLDEVRSLRPVGRDNAEKSFRALFEPEITGDVKFRERYAVATFVAGLHRHPGATEFYKSRLRDRAGAEFAVTVVEEIFAGGRRGTLWRISVRSLERRRQEGADFCRVRSMHVAYSARNSLPRSTTRISWCFVRAMQAPGRCSAYSLQDGRLTGS